MTNTQLYLLIAVPVLFNFGITLTFFIVLNTNINAQLAAMRSEFGARFDAQTASINSQLAVIDTRLRHLEDK